MAAQGNATVKAVLSGDTLVLMGQPNKGPPPEITITLSSLQAPRLARGSDQVTEPWAWESREFLRKLAVGKQVSFKVDYKVPSINRSFGTVKLNGQSLNLMVAKAGWAAVKPVAGGAAAAAASADSKRDGQSEEHDALLAAQDAATAAQIGKFSPESSYKTPVFTDINAEDFFKEHKNKKIESVIEMVRDGSSMRVMLLPLMRTVNFYLAGVQAPRMNPVQKPGEATVGGPAPFAAEAKYFIEVRLLNRNVETILQGVDKFGNFYGTIVHPAGNISAELLKNGMAKMTDWSAAFATMKDRTAMRECEKLAKQQKLRLWTGYEAPVLQGDGGYSGQVVEVVSGDTLVVLVPSKGEKRVSLASIRAPRMGNARRGEQDSPYAWESKEFLRSLCVGAKVEVKIDYERKPMESSEQQFALTRSFGSVKLCSNEQGKAEVNLAEAVVKNGLAEVIRHRAEEERASNYDVLLAEEEKAKATRKGMYSGKEAGKRRYTDLTTDSTKAKQYLPFLKRSRVLSGVVEVVITGARLKIYVAKENCVLNFVMSGIKCPLPSRASFQDDAKGKSVAARQAEPFGDEAKTFSRAHLMQRNVEIEIEDMDRMGSAFGPVYVVGAEGKRETFACKLLREGLATCDEYSSQRTRVCADLERAEKVARDADIGIWKTRETPKEVVQVTADETWSKTAMSEIVSGKYFFLHVADNGGAAALKKIEDQLRAFTAANGTQGSTVEIKRNAIVAALFDDGSGPSWFRAKVENARGSAGVRVRYIDYGNCGTVPVSKIRALDAALVKIPPQARECALAFTKVPALDEEYGQDAAMILNDLAWGKSLRARVHGRDEANRSLVTLYDGDMCITEQLVEAGVARLDRKAHVRPFQKDVVEAISAAQEKARKSRACMWQYGDVESDDDAY